MGYDDEEGSKHYDSDDWDIPDFGKPWKMNASVGMDGNTAYAKAESK